MKLWKILAPIALCLVLVLLIVPGKANAASVVGSGICGGNLTWTLDDTGTLTISGTGPMVDYGGASFVPWYSSRSSIKSVIIEDGVTSIEMYAIRCCNELSGIWVETNNPSYSSDSYGVLFNKGKTKLMLAHAALSGSYTIPNSVTAIGNQAFQNCGGLTELNIPDSVAAIGNQAFQNCDGLTELNIPDSVTAIGNQAFQNCDGLTELNIPDSVKTLGESVFTDCRNLRRVTLGNGIVAIGSCYDMDGYVSYNKYKNGLYLGNDENPYMVLAGIERFASVETLDIHTDTRLIASEAVCNRTNITTVNIPDKVTYIGYSAFGCCSGLLAVDIPDSVTTIGDNAFLTCVSLATVTFGDNVSTIGRGAFEACISLKEITIPEKVTTLNDYIFKGCKTLTNVNVHDDVISVGRLAFENCTGLEKISLGENITTIGEYAFYSCTNLAEVTLLGNKITTIGGFAFYNCSSLTEIKLPDSVTTIGAKAFADCSGLKNVVIGKGVTTIGNSAFDNCNLNTLTISDNVVSTGPGLGISGDAFELCKVKKLIIAEGSKTVSTTIVAKWGLQEVVLPESLVTIEGQAFQQCTELKSVTIPDNVTTIGYGAFSGCDGLTSVTFGKSVKEIGGQAFDGCGQLTAVVIPDSVTTIGNSAFNGCRRLANVTIGENVVTIGNKAFEFCGITTVKIPDSVTSVGAYAFAKCYALTDVILGRNMTEIATYMFSECWLLNNITISDKVTTIDEYAFWNFNGIQTPRNVWYTGSKEDRKNITILSNNENLTSATWHYNYCPINTEHAYDDACDAVCNACETTRTAPHIFDHDCDGTCNACDFVRTPLEHNYTLNSNHTCSVCKYSKTPEKPTVESKTYNSVTLAATAGFAYSMDGTLWQDSNVFTGLSADTEYTFYQRVKESKTAFASDISKGATVKTDAEPTYTIVFKNWNGEVLSTAEYHWGDTVVAPADPTREADMSYTYAFAGWDQEIVSCAGDATYTATYTPTYIDYVITFQYEDGTIIQQYTLHYGEPLVVPVDPAAPQVSGKRFSFCGWDKTTEHWSGNTTYTAMFAEKLVTSDIDDDEETDTEDAVYLLLAVMFGTEDYPIRDNVSLDVNNDGKVNTDDAVYLLLHIMFGEEDYPLYA